MYIDEEFFEPNPYNFTYLRNINKIGNEISLRYRIMYRDEKMQRLVNVVKNIPIIEIFLCKWCLSTCSKVVRLPSVATLESVYFITMELMLLRPREMIDSPLLVIFERYFPPGKRRTEINLFQIRISFENELNVLQAHIVHDVIC